MVWFAEAITHPAGPFISLAAFDYDMIQMPAKHSTVSQGIVPKEKSSDEFPTAADSVGLLICAAITEWC